MDEESCAENIFEMKIMKISVVIPAYHEERTIQTLIDSTRKSAVGFDFEMIIVDGTPEKGTLKKVKNLDIKKISSLPGRGIQMNEGAANAEGDVLLFLHADTILPTNAFYDITTLLADSSIIGGAFKLGIDSSNRALGFIAFMANVRSKLFKTPFGDQAIFIRTEYFRQIGGYLPIPIMEDYEIMKRIRKAGGKIKLLESSVRTSARRWNQEGVFYSTFRNFMLRILYNTGVSPEKLVLFYKKGREAP